MRQYQVKTISSLERGLRVLKALEEMRAASLHDLHQVTGIPKASLIRILHTCNKEGLVWQRLADGAFVASLRPHLHAFTRGLEKDRAAVDAALTLPHHNGGTEGVNNKTKLIKRQMCGRASFPLLRHRILLG